MRKTLFALVLIVTAFALWGRFAPPAMAATITVNTIDDIIGVDGACSLREAIENANDNAATHADCAAGELAVTDSISIDLPSYETIYLNSDLPTITDNLLISSLNPSVYIDGDDFYRMFVVPAGVSLELRYLKLANAYLPAPSSGAALNIGGAVNLYAVDFYGSDLSDTDSRGAAIFVESTGSLTGQYMELVENYAANGGAIHNEGIVNLNLCGFFDNSAFERGGAVVNYGTMTISECIFDFNGVNDTIYGGAVANYGLLTVDEVYFIDNGSINTAGGAIYHEGDVGAGFEITRSIFEENDAAEGGALFVINGSACLVDAARCLANSRDAVSGSAIVRESFFVDNEAELVAGSIFNGDGDMTVVSSAFDDNFSYSGDAEEIHNGDGTITIINSTFEGDYEAPVITNTSGATSILNHVTIYGEESGLSAGVAADAGSTLQIANSVLFTDDDCLIDGTLTDLGGNFEGGTSCGFANNNTDPLFDLTLEFNGSYLETLALDPSSPVINGATGPAPLDLGDADRDLDTSEVMPFDNRGDGYLRQIGAARDSGAFEYNGTPIDFIVDRTDDTLAGACTTAPNDCTLRGALELSNYDEVKDIVTFDPVVFGTPQTINQDPFAPIYEYWGESGFYIEKDVDVVGPGANILTITQEAFDPYYEYSTCGCTDHSIFLISDIGGSPFMTDARSSARAERGDRSHNRSSTGAAGDRSKPVQGVPPTTIIENINITGMTVTGGFDIAGGAVEIFIISSFSPLTTTREPDDPGIRFEDMVFDGNSAITGGAVHGILGIPLSFVGTIFTDNFVYGGDGFGPFLTDGRFSASPFGSASSKPVHKPLDGVPPPFFFYTPNVGGAITVATLQLNIFDSLFVNNYTGEDGIGGAIAASSAFFTPPPMTDGRDGPGIPAPILLVVNTTFDSNRSYGGPHLDDPTPDISPSGAGGAIATQMDAVIANSTFANNDAEAGSSLYLLGLGGGTGALEGGRSPLDSAFLQNVIFADTTGADNCFNDGMTLDPQAILSTDDSCDGFTTDISDIGLDPLGLQDNGGQSMTIALTEDSVAVNNGIDLGELGDFFDTDNDTIYAEPLPFDQRGFGFDRVLGGTVDIGAYESPFAEEPSDLTGSIIFDDPALLTDPLVGGIDATEGATIGDMFCFVIDPEPLDDFSVYVQIAEPFLSELQLVDPASPLTPADIFEIEFDVETVDTTICNPEQVFGITALENNADDFGADVFAGAVELVDIDFLFIDEADVTTYDAGVVTTPPATQPLAEGGTTTYTFALSGPPGVRSSAITSYETVTIDLRSYNNRFIAPTPTAVTFTRANWDTLRSIDVVAIEDLVNRGERYQTSILHAPRSNITAPFQSMFGGPLPNYNPINFKVRFAITDNDLMDGEPLTQEQYDALNLAAWLDLAPTHAVALEGGTGALVLHVRIAGQPLDDQQVVIDLNTIAGVTVSPSQLIFTAHNWDVYQPIMITVPLNGTVEGAYTIPLQAVINAAMTTAMEFVGAADVVQVGVADDPALIPPVVIVPEQPAAPFVPAPEPAGDGSEGTSSE